MGTLGGRRQDVTAGGDDNSGDRATRVVPE